MDFEIVINVPQHSGRMLWSWCSKGMQYMHICLLWPKDCHSFNLILYSIVEMGSECPVRMLQIMLIFCTFICQCMHVLPPYLICMLPAIHTLRVILYDC